MTRRTAVCLAKAALVGAAAISLLSGCGLRDPYNQPPPTRPAQQTTQPRPPVLTVALPPASADQPAVVLYRFATLYATVTPAGAEQRAHALAALADPAFAARLNAGARSARADAVRGMPPGAVTVGGVASLALSADGRGVVVLQERLKTARGVIGAPVTDVCNATLVHLAAGWRVASFELQP
jgi:predicted small lipoprotein YifL